MDDLIYIDLALDLGLLHMLRLMLGCQIIIFVRFRINDFIQQQYTYRCLKRSIHRKTADKYGISQRIFGGWIKKYWEQGIDGLRSQTGKTKHPGKGNPFSGLQNKKNKTREEELELEKKKILII